MKHVIRVLAAICSCMILLCTIPQLSAEAYSQPAYQTIAAALAAHQEEIDLARYGMDEDTFGELYFGISYQPEYFYVEPEVQYQISASGVVQTAYPYYNCTKSVAESRLAAMEKVADQAMLGVQDGWSEAEIALYFHDWLIQHVTYDDTLENHSAYEALVEQSAICSGYAGAYTYLLAQAGISCWMIECQSMQHAWSLVQADGAYYYVDVTWDDPDQDSYVLHDNVLVSASALRQTDHTGTDWFHYAFDTLPEGDSRYEDAFFAGQYYAPAALGTSWVTVVEGDEDAEIQVLNLQSDGSSQVVWTTTISDWWYTGINSEWYYVNLTMCASNGSCCYYNTSDSIYLLTMENGVPVQKLVYTLSASDYASYGNFYALSIENGALVMTQGWEPDSPLRKFSIPVALLQGDVTPSGLGDVNGSQTIDSDDAVVVLLAYTQQMLQGTTYLTDAQEEAADIDGNGIIDSDDAVLILRYYTASMLGEVSWETLLSQ